MLIRLTAPDPRICQQCHGAGWYYVETPDENRPLGAVLRQCNLPHADRVLIEGDRETVLYGPHGAR